MKKGNRRPAPGQQDLFAAVRAAYQGATQMDNDQLYDKLASNGVIELGSLDERTPIGRTAQRHNTMKRRVRWIQQTLKAMGAIERVPGQRGTWQLKSGEEQLTAAAPGRVLVAFSTNLGLALWADCSALGSLNEPTSLVLSSPPYPLARPRAYGNPTQDQFSEFICRSLEPVLRSLVPGGNVCLNVSNDIFRAGTPARSTYLERLTLDIERRLGLFLMDRLPGSIHRSHRVQRCGPVVSACSLCTAMSLFCGSPQILRVALPTTTVFSSRIPPGTSSSRPRGASSAMPNTAMVLIDCDRARSLGPLRVPYRATSCSFPTKRGSQRPSFELLFKPLVCRRMAR